MMLALRLAVFVALLLEPAGATAQSAQFKGWAAVSRELSIRLAPQGHAFDLDEFLPSRSMDELLGTWTTFGTEHRFRNGLPNALNMTIWHAALSGFAKAVGQSCTSPQLTFHERFLATLHNLCAWPAPAAKNEGVLLAFWTSVMGYNAGEREYAAWRDFFLNEYASKPATETVAAMTFAITMNPSFLLNR
ncbi:MAG: hypothetical protein J2P51_05170 [Hyphomicrobiaceae bacterium]|nr:hypothetical protein [Hyphomicrobiaceae bacterium]